LSITQYYYNAIYIEGLAISRGSMGENRRRMGKKENLGMLQFFTRTTRYFIDQVKMVVYLRKLKCKGIGKNVSKGQL